ncbi:MAG: tetratricopeptide repeat protein [Deltaproteobacteria bacterium]|nr:tetratricopeptide repeat protein [Deltaproteobacteria bacterium]
MLTFLNPNLALLAAGRTFGRSLALALLLAASAVPLAIARPAAAATAGDIEAAKTLVEDEKYYDAFSKLDDILNSVSPGDPARNAAQLLQGKVLMGLGLYQSALRSFDSVSVPADHPFYKEKIKYFLQIQRAVPGDLATLERLADAPEAVHNQDDLDEVRFLLGRYYYGVGEFDKAIAKLQVIKPSAKEFYLKARHLIGVIYITPKMQKYDMAVEAFKDILRFEETMGAPSYFAQYRDMANMSLGRLFYSARQFEAAGRYYDRVTEGTSAWLDSLFELGWTYFQIGRIDRVLGQLHTLNSPFFEDRYYPEARVLEALILFRTCRFSETLVTVQKFLRDYKPLKKELDAQLSGQRTDAEFYDYLFSLSRDKKSLSVQLRRIFNVALSDKRLQRAFGAVVQANDEYAGLEKLERNTKATAAAAQLREDMGRVRAVMIAEAGGLARQRLTRVREDLTEIIRQGLRIKYESLKARRGSISDAVRADMAETAKATTEPRQEDEEHIVWPFDGSYWRDELGGYTYEAQSKCTVKELGRAAVGADAPKVGGKAGTKLDKAGASGADKGDSDKAEGGK